VKVLTGTSYCSSESEDYQTEALYIYTYSYHLNHCVQLSLQLLWQKKKFQKTTEITIILQTCCHQSSSAKPN